MTKRVRKAIIPAAGLGTRFLPATRAVPKEMIPVLDIPMIQFVVEEAVQSGIEEIIFISARGKEAIENHFDFNYELEDRLEKAGKSALLKTSKHAAEMCKVISVRQKHPMGLGHAVACAESVVGDEPFVVMLPDEMMDCETPCIRQLIDVYEKEGKSVVAVMEVPEADVSKYGIIGGKQKGERLHAVEKVVEKPLPKNAPTRLALPGRYLFEPELFECLKEVKPGRGGEIQLTDGMELLAQRKGMLGYQFEGKRYDTGDRVDFLDATLAVALKRPELKGPVIKLLQKHLKEAGK